jgi:hypothetical protein
MTERRPVMLRGHDVSSPLVVLADGVEVLPPE